MSAYHQRHDFIWRAQDEVKAKCNVQLLNPLPYLCENSFCKGEDNGIPRYYDDNHLSETGNRKLVPMFESVFE